MDFFHRAKKGKMMTRLSSPFNQSICSLKLSIYLICQTVINSLLLLQGFAPHISPFTSVQDLGNLLNRAGFTMLTIVSSNCYLPQIDIHRLLYYYLIFWCQNLMN